MFDPWCILYIIIAVATFELIILLAGRRSKGSVLLRDEQNALYETVNNVRWLYDTHSTAKTENGRYTWCIPPNLTSSIEESMKILGELSHIQSKTVEILAKMESRLDAAELYTIEIRGQLERTAELLGRIEHRLEIMENRNFGICPFIKGDKDEQVLR